MLRNGPRIPLKLQALFVAAATGRDEPEIQGALSSIKNSKSPTTVACGIQASVAGQSRHKPRLQTTSSPRKQSKYKSSTQVTSPQKTTRRPSAPKRASSEPVRRSSPRKPSRRLQSQRSSPTKKSSKRSSEKRVSGIMNQVMYDRG